MNPGAAAAASADERFDAVFAIHLPARPYPGLRPFEQHEWPIFFGRERMTDEIVDRLLGHRLLPRIQLTHSRLNSSKLFVIARRRSRRSNPVPVDCSGLLRFARNDGR